MPSCSSRITWYGPATRVTKYVDSGGVVGEVPARRPRRRRRLDGRRVADDHPVRRCRHVHRVRRLEVGLVEAGVDARRGVHEVHAVDVGRPSAGSTLRCSPSPSWRNGMVASTTSSWCPSVRLEGEPAALQQVHVEGPPVEPDRLERDRLEVEERGAAAAVERDRRDRRERRLVPGQVEPDVVRRERRAARARASASVCWRDACGAVTGQRMSDPVTWSVDGRAKPRMSIRNHSIRQRVYRASGKHRVSRDVPSPRLVHQEGSLPCRHRSSVAEAACSPPDRSRSRGRHGDRRARLVRAGRARRRLHGARTPIADSRRRPVNGMTVSQGVTPAPFTGEVIGVLDDGIAPGLDMVIVDLDSPAIDGRRRHLAGHVRLAGLRGDGRPDRRRRLRPGLRPVADRRRHAVRGHGRLHGARRGPARPTSTSDTAQQIAAASDVTARQAQQGFAPLGVADRRLRASARPGSAKLTPAKRAYFPKSAYAAGPRLGRRARPSTTSSPAATSPRRTPTATSPSAASGRRPRSATTRSSASATRWTSWARRR